MDGEEQFCVFLAPFRRPLCLLQYRLQRLLQETLASPSPAALRRLGALLRQADRLVESIEAFMTAKQPVVQQPFHGDEISSPAPRCPGVSGYDRHLAEVLDVLLRDLARGYTLLDTSLASSGSSPATLPLSAVGSLAVTYNASTGRHSNTKALLVSPPHTFPPPRIPAPVYREEVRASAYGAPEDELRRNVSVSPALPCEQPASSSRDVETEEGEAAVLSDVEALVQQIKERATEMGNWVTGADREALDANEKLLSSGVERGRENMKQLERLPDAGTGKRVPAFLARLPYGSLLWQQVLEPIWELIYRVLILLFVIAITGMTLLLIFMRAKPIAYRRLVTPLSIPNPLSHAASTLHASSPDDTDMPATRPYHPALLQDTVTDVSSQTYNGGGSDSGELSFFSLLSLDGLHAH